MHSPAVCALQRALWGHSQQLNTVVGQWQTLSEGHWFADRHLRFYTVPSSGPAFSIQQDQTLSFASRLTKSQQTGCQGHTTDSQSDWPFNAEPLYPQAIQSGSETIKSKGREGVSGGWVLRMSKASQPRLHCRLGQITLFGLFAWLQLKGPICEKLIFSLICNSSKYWRWRNVGRPPSHSVSIWRVGNSCKLEL